MSSRLEYEIMLNLYEASSWLNEQNYLFTLNTIGVTEAAEMEALNEGFSEVVRGYMNKVMQNTQKAWDKFKNIITKSVSDIILTKWKPEEIKRALADDSVSGIEIDNYSDYDLSKLGNYDIRELNYSSMQPHLDSVDDFLKNNYRDIYSDEKTDLKSGLRKFITRKKEDKHTLTHDEMRAIGDFVLQEHKALQDKIEANIKRINRSADEVESLLSSTAQESTALSLEDTERIYFKEDGEEEPKMKIATPEKDENGGEKKENSNSALKTHIMNYMKGTTKVLTAQMSLSNEILMLYSRILAKYMSNWKSGQKGEESQKEDNGKGSDNSKIQKIQ